MKIFTTSALKAAIVLAVASIQTMTAQTQLTTTEAQSMFYNTSKRRVSIHDPSVVYQENTGRYYIFGSHKAGAYTTDMMNWTQANPTWGTSNSQNASNSSAFTTPAVTRVKKGGQWVTLPSFNAQNWSARSESGYSVDGNMWAPDVIWNPTMNKWCYYLSINGDQWHSSIILLTSDNITGPYRYQGPVVTCGFYDSSHSWKETDLEIVIGTQSSLPSRYNVGSNWGNRWPHTIDPCVFYDEGGNMWLAYGSWSGGIWMLQLDETTGLRDYNVSYPSTGGSTNQVTSDPYFGTKVAGGVYVSGEGPYIEHIGNYYYLFMSYGFYSPDGGYEMRVFRSENPNGPYTDTQGVSAIFNSYVMNYGTRGDTRGEKIMGAYNNWGTMTVGECAQGHNSIIAANDGRTYLVYHTKFNNNTVFHEVRVHQVFVNRYGWLVAAPFEYNGETVTDADIASRQPFTAEQMAGTYKLLIHKYGMNYASYEEVTPVEVTLTANGQVSGSLSGTWSMEAGTGHIMLTLGGTAYSGVVLEEQMDGNSTHTISITACSQPGVNVWAYKMHPKYELAQQVLNLTMPLTDGQEIGSDIDLYGITPSTGNATLTWTSSRPDIISNEGHYNASALSENTPVTLTMRLETPGYYWEREFHVTAIPVVSSLANGDWMTGLIAHYGFDSDQLANSYNTSEVAQPQSYGTATAPTVENGGPQGNGRSVHMLFGINGNESCVKVTNPLRGQTLSEGATISMWVKRTDNNLWDALFGLANGENRLYMTGNTYVGYNNGNDNWIDINHPGSVETGNLAVGQWQLATLAIARTGITLYVNGKQKAFSNWNGVCNGNNISSSSGFDYNLITDLLTTAQDLYLGRGSFWGSADAYIDDLIIYNRPITAAEAEALYKMETQALFDFASVPQIERSMVNARLYRLRTLMKVPHWEETDGVDAAATAAIASIEQRMTGSGTIDLATLMSEAEEAEFAFLSQATPTDPEQPFDLTYMMLNPGMDNTNGWNGEPTLNFSCAEYYQQDFDFNQTVKLLPAGTYQMRSNAFQRPGTPEACSNAAVAAYIYAGSDSRTLAHITSDAQSTQLGGAESFANGKYFPNNMEAASIYFAKGLYDNRVTTSLATDRGQLTMGIRGSNASSFYWCIFDNFRLHYFGTMDKALADNFKFIAGDVNCDGDVSVTDVICLVQEMLGYKQQTFCYRAADMDSSKELSINDVMGIVDLVLKK